MNRKLDAFTLVEMMAVMVITGLVAFAVLSAMNQVQLWYQKGVQMESEAVDILHFHHQLSSDIWLANSVEEEGGQLILKSSKATIVYEFHGDEVIRKQNYQEQVFHLKDVRFKFGHHEWASDLLSFVQWEHRHGKQIKQWSVHKKYDYLTLLNHE